MSDELVEARPFLLMDREDEKQIIAEMRGEILKEYVYSYKDKGRTIEGLSLAGINAVSIYMAEMRKPMRALEQHITEDSEFVKAVVKVGRYSVKDDGTEVGLDSAYGAKRQAKFYASGKENPFAFEQAISKAERNARKKLIPEKVIVELMKQYKEEGKVKKIEATDVDYQVQNEKPKKAGWKVTDDEEITKEQLSELKRLAKEVGYKNPVLSLYKTQQDYEDGKSQFEEMKRLALKINKLRAERVMTPEEETEFMAKHNIKGWDKLLLPPLRLRAIVKELEKYPLENRIEKAEEE